MLQPDEDFGKPYYPDATEPERANAEGTVLWELSELAKRSYHDSVRVTASHFSKYDANSTKRSEVEYFLNNKFKRTDDLVILEDAFPTSCKKMQHRRIQMPKELSVDIETFADASSLTFFSGLKEA